MKFRQNKDFHHKTLNSRIKGLYNVFLCFLKKYIPLWAENNTNKKIVKIWKK